MYNCLYKFFEDNKLVYNLKFGFRQKHSTTHALIHQTKKIREQLDSGKYGCRIFVDFQKGFNTINHTILTQKLRQEVRPIIGFSLILKTEHNLLLNGCFNSVLKETNCSVPQGSILAPLLFLIYISDLHYSIKFCKVHHFADETNLINFNSSIKVINK